MNELPDPNTLLIGALAFMRVGGIMFALPMIGDAPTPVRARVFLALATTIGLYSTIPAGWSPVMNVGVLEFGGYVLRELSIGLVVGFLARVAFDGLLMAASIVAFQMGFGTASLFVPDFGGQIDGFTAFHRLIVLLIFLSLGMHQIFFDAIATSFKLIPGGGAVMNESVGVILLSATAGILSVAVQLAAPILVALLFTMAALGLVARAVPQMNVFTMSFPISFFIGLVVYIATFPFFPEWMREHFLTSHQGVIAAMRGMVGA
jgi:flagellar biosynthetic protein FliR